MLYEIDAFGYLAGYISKNWQVMSEEDILADGKLARRLYEAKYQVWKRHNILELKDEYQKKNSLYKDSFERFCREIFGNL